MSDIHRKAAPVPKSEARDTRTTRPPGPSVLDSLQNDHHVRLEAGDIVFTRGHGFISRAIRYFSRSCGESRTQVNHVGLITAPGNMHTAVITEARTKVRSLMVVDAYGSRGDSIAIYRCRNLTHCDRQKMARRAMLRFQNLPYGWAKIVLHALDGLLNGAYFFRRLAFLPNRPICSYLVVWAYERMGMHFGVDAWQATPDDIWDFVNTASNYTCIRRLRPYRR